MNSFWYKKESIEQKVIVSQKHFEKDMYSITDCDPYSQQMIISPICRYYFKTKPKKISKNRKNINYFDQIIKKNNKKIITK